MNPQSKPDSRPLRVMFGFTGLAAATAMLTAVTLPAGASITSTVPAVGDQAAVPVQHVIRYVQLQPGQTAPPNSTVQAAPQATPRVVVVTTHQSGKI